MGLIGFIKSTFSRKNIKLPPVDEVLNDIMPIYKSLVSLESYLNGMNNDTVVLKVRSLDDIMYQIRSSKRKLIDIFDIFIDKGNFCFMTMSYNPISKTWNECLESNEKDIFNYIYDTIYMIIREGKSIGGYLQVTDFHENFLDYYENKFHKSLRSDNKISKKIRRYDLCIR